MAQDRWHAEDVDEVFDALDTSEDGLSSDEAARRLETEGRNEIDTGKEIHPWKIFIDQFKDFLIYLLFFAMAVSITVGIVEGNPDNFVDATLIFIILLGNGIFGFIQDYQAEKSIEALKEMSSPDAVVLRDGKKKKIDSKDVVPGDIVFIEQGDAIPADARLISVSSLATDESALTGESIQVRKAIDTYDEDAAVADRRNMVFMNTTAVTGRAKAVVVDTGMQTEVGSIAEQLSEAEDKQTPFQEEVDRLGKQIGYGILLIIGFVAIIEAAFTTASWLSIILVAITLAVAAVPEGLPAVVTLSLAMGSKKMLKKNALVRRLPVVESLGSVDTIVTDKTGTLTEDRMTVEKVAAGDRVFDVTGDALGEDGSFEADGDEVMTPDFERMIRCGYVCNNAEIEADGDMFGDPTEVALLVSAKKAGITPKANIVKEVPFSSDRKRMTVVAKEDGSHRAYMKGAAEIVLDRCDRYRVDGEVRELTEEKKQAFLEQNQDFAREALRVLGFAEKQVEDIEADDDEIEEGMVFLGLQGMIDPPRSEVKEAVEDCRSAGIRVVMATGDNVETAKAIGEKVGFDPSGALTGKDIDAMSEEELEEAVQDVEIFARVSPENKVQILEALQANGHRVAMTGDGVNDAPAIKKSDVGISMGIRGTDVAEQASDMVLQDDNFVTIRDAIEAGRGIFDNIRKFVNYLLSANAGEVLVVFFGIVLGSFFFPDVFSTGGEALILTPVMLLWINLVTDGFPALALGVDPVSDGVMDREPRKAEEGVIDEHILFSIIGIGIIMTLTLLPLFFWNVSTSLMKAQTILFTAMVVMELIRVQLIRRRYNQSIFSNKWLLLALGSSILLQLVVVYTPLSGFFEVSMLDLMDWAEIGVSFVAFVILSVILSKISDWWLGRAR